MSPAEAAQIMLMHSAKWSWLKAWAMKIARHRGRRQLAGIISREDVIRSLKEATQYN